MRRYAILAALCCLMSLGAGLAIGSFIHRQSSTVTFSVNIPDGSTVKVYRDQGGDAPFQYDPSKPLFSLKSDQKITAKAGIYDFVVSPDTDYQINVVKKTINTTVKSVTVNPDFSASKLKASLSADKDGVTSALFKMFGNARKYYFVDKVELFKHGEWAGVTLKSKAGEWDPVRFVLSKEGDSWTVINDPSVLVIGSLYKNVPPDVVASVNSM